ncbi:DUF1330 domain-containing protein [Vibrio sp. AK197]|uniref:DUF1330 domain-containing protein n=1 Tax=Vibrio olivae TaxID=1243002 RepID=A0ABV5HPI9_9VIBR
MQGGKPAYFMFDTKVTDSEALKPYLEQVAGTLTVFGGKLLIAAGGHIDVVEGKPPQGGVVMLEFDSIEKANAWYHSSAYQAIISHRLAGSQANAWLLEGLAK